VGKVWPGVLLTTHQFLVRGHTKVELYSTQPLGHNWPVTGTLYLYQYNNQTTADEDKSKADTRKESTNLYILI
jgi:hypothetical protein